MKWMHKLVIPKINYCWSKVADFLEYPLEKKKEIEVNKFCDPYNCCAALLEDWLSSDEGVTPKTWCKLLSVLKEIPELSNAAHTIEERLLKEGLLVTNH